jgi:hypothetical protein
LKYLESLYAYKYSQDYGILTPYGSWMVTPLLWLKASLPLTMYLGGKNTYLVSPTLDAHYDSLSWLSFNFGGNYTKSTAPTVSVDAGPPAVVASGTLFTHYTTTGFYLAVSFHLPADLELGLSKSMSTTAYDLESVPTPPGGKPADPRSDKLNTTNATLTQSFIKNIWSGSLSWTYYDNQSIGFSGLASGTSLANYTYTRTYTSVSTTIYY